MVFKEGDLVWVHLRKEHFPLERKSKLMPRVDGPFQILRKLNDNAYQLDFQGNYDISSSFNVADLSLFRVDDPDLWTNSFEEGGNDEPQDTDQDMDSDQPVDQDNSFEATEVHSPSKNRSSDRAVYRFYPRASDHGLRMEPRSND